MNKSPVLVIGTGHLAYRLKKLLNDHGYTIIHLAANIFKLEENEDSALGTIANVLKDVDLTNLSMTYIVDDQDEFNLELIIALISLNQDIHITASLFNENIAPHLQAAHPNIQVLNPAKIAAPIFVEALSTPIKHFLRYAPAKRAEESSNWHPDGLLSALIILFCALILGTAAYFHIFEHLSWLNAFYFVVVTIATVGYGDISLLNSVALTKVVGIGLILGSTFFIWMIFSLTVDSIIKKRVQLSLGRKRYSYKDHVILCGLGRLGYFIAEELLHRGEKIVIIEMDENSPDIDYFRQRGASVYIGNARRLRVLQDAGVMRAKAVISAIGNDYTNLEIGLNARSFDPKLRLILRIFDESMSRKIKENLDIHLTFSVTAIADEKFFDILKTTK
ncbi:MAG: hypothetical protein JWN50_468 [Parcubacteria group bacterium]|nr:hypothetical protein [Parcubacteria group bacterium]